MNLDLDKSTWKRIAFGDAIENVAVRVDDPSTSGVDRYVGLEHLDPGGMTVERWGTPDQVSAQKLLFEPGDVIFGRRRAYQKKVARADFNGICSAHALVLRARPDFVHSDFLPVFLSSDYFLDRAIAISVGSLSPTINWRDLKIEQFDFPSRDEQKLIADLLWVVEKERRALVTLSAAVAKVRQLWLDRSVAALVAGSSANFESFWVRSPESGWSAAPVDEDTGRYALSLAALGPGGYRRGNLKNVPNTSEVRHATLRNGDLLISRANTVDAVGRAGIYDESRDDVSFPDTMMRLHLAERVTPCFALAVLSSSHGRAHMRRTAAGSATSMVKINRESLGRLAFPVTSDRVQASLVQQLGCFHSCLDSLGALSASLLRTRATISTAIFGGSP